MKRTNAIALMLRQHKQILNQHDGYAIADHADEADESLIFICCK